MTALTVLLMLEVLVLVFVWREDDVASGDEEKHLCIPTLGDKEAACTLGPRRVLGTDRKTEDSSKRLANIYGRIGRVGGCEELWAHRASNDRLADLDVDVSDIVFHKKVPALEGHDDAIIARERSSNHADPEDDGGGRFFDVPDADDVGASSLHLHRVQKHMELEG